MGEIDRRAQEEYSIPGLVLMENAGLKSYLFLKNSYWNGGLPKGRVVFLAGKGNNGGDAMVIARQCRLDGLDDGVIVSVGAGGSEQAQMCRKLGIPIREWPEEEARRAIAEASFIIDGLSGTGIRGPLRKPVDEVVERANEARATRIAVDVPSGVGDAFRPGYPAVRADITLTMGLPKLSLYLPHARPLCGTIHVIPIGFPRPLVESESIPGELLTLDVVRRLVPPVGPDAYKNRRGTVGVFAGAVGTSGAAILSSQAAARSRAGLVTLFITPEAYQQASAQLGGVMVRPCSYEESTPESVGADHFTVRLVGPGWGTVPSRRKWLRGLLSAGPGVLDADGINLLAAEAENAPALGGRWVLTPHPGELSRLCGVSRDEILTDPLPPLLETARRLEAVVVLKSHVTFVGAPDGRYWILDGMTPSLGTGGSGDILAGIIAGFLAGGLTAATAACAGVLVHNRAGRRAFAEIGWFAAEDILPFVSMEARLDENE